MTFPLPPFSTEARSLGLTSTRRPSGLDGGDGYERGAWGLIGAVPVGVRRLTGLDGVARDAVHAALWPPLDLGLHVRPQGAVAKWFLDLVGAEDHPVGDDAFDRTYRVGAEEASRAALLLEPAVREAIGEVAPGDEVVLRDDLVAVRGHQASIARRVHQVARIARRLRRAAANVPPAAALTDLEPAMRRLAANYGLTFTATPLSAEGTVADLAMGVLVRRLEDGTRALEVGCVVDPRMRHELEVLPRAPAVETRPPDLFEPSFHLNLAPVPSELARTHVVRASTQMAHRLGRVLTPAAVVAMAQLQGEVDVVLQYGVLTLRRSLTTLDAAALEGLFDRAVAGARTIVPAVASGYRGGTRR